MNLLTLDLSTNTGWTVGPLDGPFTHGDYRIEGADLGQFACHFDWWLRGKLSGVDLCIFEAPIMGPKGITARRKLMGLAWHTEFICHERRIEVREANIQKIKMFTTGMGNATKGQMVNAIEQFGHKVNSHDEADAIACRLYSIAVMFPEAARKLKLDMGLLGAA